MSDAAEHGIVRVRVRPGHAAVLIDLSDRGALIETAHRLLPGTTVDVHLETAENRESVRGRVLRSTVAGVAAGGMSYRGAIRFDAPLTSLVAPRAETDGHRREAATRIHAPRTSGDAANVE